MQFYSNLSSAFGCYRPGIAATVFDMSTDDSVAKWWDDLNDDQRSRVKQAAENHDLDRAGAKALIDTRCPVGPVGTRWDSDPNYRWTWPESVRQFVLDQD